jgi:NADH-quinone oxidoreductase subunit C
MKTFDELLSIAAGYCKHSQAVADESMTPKGIRIHPSDIHDVCLGLSRHPDVYIDMLSCITAVDNGPETGTLELIYNLYSIPFNHHLSLKISIPRDNVGVDSGQGSWTTANWHEREAADMFGGQFKGNPEFPVV